MSEMSIWAQLRTLPNLLSLLRLALVPVFLVLIVTGHSITAFIVLNIGKIKIKNTIVNSPNDEIQIGH